MMQERLTAKLGLYGRREFIADVSPSADTMSRGRL